MILKHFKVCPENSDKEDCKFASVKHNGFEWEVDDEDGHVDLSSHAHLTIEFNKIVNGECNTDDKYKEI